MFCQETFAPWRVIIMPHLPHLSKAQAKWGTKRQLYVLTLLVLPRPRRRGEHFSLGSPIGSPIVRRDRRSGSKPGGGCAAENPWYSR
jgi:hypothetical protein